MASKKTIDDRIAEAQERITQYENQMKQLIQKRKDEERKSCTKRLIERGAILESLMDGAAALTNEQVKTVLTAALNSGAARETLLTMREPQAAAQPSAEAPERREPEQRAGA